MSYTTKNTPQDVFLHLFNIIVFYISAVGMIALLVQYVNAYFPDALNYYFTSIVETIRLSVSLLLIAVPAYIATSWLIGKDLNKNPEKRDWALRKWLIYFTLFVSAITIIIDLITFVHSFLSGELSGRFALKVLIVLVIAGCVFGYYIWELKRDAKKSAVSKKLAIVLALVVLFAIAMGFVLIGTPNEQRKRRFDEERVQDLSMLQSRVLDYWTQNGVIPQQAEQLVDPIYGYILPVDPETNTKYAYTKTGDLTFTMCADFTTQTDARHENQLYERYSLLDENWNHASGTVCFDRTIDPALHKPFDVPKPAVQ